jgi:hypothetical protein
MMTSSSFELTRLHHSFSPNQLPFTKKGPDADPHESIPKTYRTIPAPQQAASVGIMPVLNRKIATAAAIDSTSANQSTLVSLGASKDNGNMRTGTVSRNTV